MKHIKKHIGPVLFILTIILINIVLWVVSIQASFLDTKVAVTSIIGSTLLMGFFLVFLLSTRMGWIVKIFGGLDGLYFWHRILAIGTTAGIFLHQITASFNENSYITNIIILGRAGNAGELARNAFIFLIIFALLAKYLKYEHFRFIHRLLIIPYFIALYHGFFSSWINLFSFDMLSIWMISTSVIGLGSSLYMILVYQRTAFRYKGFVLEKEYLNETIIELKVKLNKTYRFKPGQFAFIKIDAPGISSSAHPFSISGSDENHIYFTIKSLGDFTESLRKALTTPANIRITKPFGHMTFQSKTQKQIWIAGGIGVTPFLSYLRSSQSLNNDIQLYYSVKLEEEAVHLDYFNQMANTNERFQFTLFEAKTKGYLSANHLELDDDTTIYMCGPRPMVLSLQTQIQQKNPKIAIHFEAFSFTGTLVEDILKTYKKFLRKLKPSKRT